MKLPPAALTAPSICPRCDAPAIMTDFCIQCSLQLRHCGACQGVAGPFDHFCGFCGHELILGERRSPVWRLWVLIALVPLAAGLVFGVSPLGGGAAGAFSKLVAGSAGPAGGLTGAHRSSAPLGFSYTLPDGWSATDYSKAPGAAASPWVIAGRNPADVSRDGDARGDALAYLPLGAVAEMGRPVQLDPAAGRTTDPGAVLALQVSGLQAVPPPGARVDVFSPIHSVTVGGRPGAEVVLKLTRDSGVLYLDRLVVNAPVGAGSTLFRLDALVPAAAYEGGDDRRVQALARSIRFV